MEDTFLKVYPNPVSDKITVEFPGSGQTSNGKVIIYSIAGEQILLHEFNSLNSEITVTDLPPGIYFIKLISKDKIATEKFVKMDY